tara:strand:+ start:322 stop:576 length:255 start_codon:yes stop_codon:yes gene_type:complete
VNGSHFTNCVDGVTPIADENMTTAPLKPWAPLPYTDATSNAENWTWSYANMTLKEGVPGVSSLGGDGHIGNLGPSPFSNPHTYL